MIALTGQCTLKGDNQYSTTLCLDRDGRKKKSAWLHMSVNTSIHYRHSLDALAFRPERGNEIAGSVCGQKGPDIEARRNQYLPSPGSRDSSGR